MDSSTQEIALAKAEAVRAGTGLVKEAEGLIPKAHGELGKMIGHFDDNLRTLETRLQPVTRLVGNDSAEAKTDEESTVEHANTINYFRQSLSNMNQRVISLLERLEV